jgi:hypothetical protein
MVGIPFYTQRRIQPPGLVGGAFHEGSHVVSSVFDAGVGHSTPQTSHANARQYAHDGHHRQHFHKRDTGFMFLTHNHTLQSTQKFVFPLVTHKVIYTDKRGTRGLAFRLSKIACMYFPFRIKELARYVHYLGTVFAQGTS